MPVLRELITVLGFDVDDAGAAQAEKLFDGLKKGALAIVGAAGAGALAIGAIVHETVRGAEETNKWAKALGVTTQELEQLNFAAERAGAQEEDLSDFLKELAIRSNDAIGGSKDMAAAFAQLGVRLTDARGKVRPVVDLFGDVAEGISKTQNAASRTFLADTLGSDAGTRLLPLLIKGRDGIRDLRLEAESLGFVLDQNTIETSQRVARQWQVLGKITLGLRRQIASKLLPTVGDLTGRLIDWLVANRELIGQGINKLVLILQKSIDLIFKLGRLISDNRRFILLLAGVLTASLIPALFLLAKAYGLVGLAALRTALVAAAPFLFVIALAVLIALVIEDVFIFVKGGESAIGNFFDAFAREAMKPDAHWVVQTLFTIIKATKEAIEAVDLFFSGFFEQASELGGITEALKDMFSTAVAFWRRQVIEFGKFLLAKIDGFLRDVKVPDFLVRLAGPASPLIRNLGGPGVPPAAPSAGAGGSTQIGIGPRSVEVKVDASSTTDPQAVADATAKKVGQILEDDRRETARVLAPQVSR